MTGNSKNHGGSPCLLNFPHFVTNRTIGYLWGNGRMITLRSNLITFKHRCANKAYLSCLNLTTPEYDNAHLWSLRKLSFPTLCFKAAYSSHPNGIEEHYRERTNINTIHYTTKCDSTCWLGPRINLMIYVALSFSHDHGHSYVSSSELCGSWECHIIIWSQ